MLVRLRDLLERALAPFAGELRAQRWVSVLGLAGKKVSGGHFVFFLSAGFLPFPPPLFFDRSAISCPLD